MAELSTETADEAETEPDEFDMERRYTAITDNDVIRKDSASQYIGRRTKLLKKGHSYEQDATILAAMHNEYEDTANWSHGIKHSIRHSTMTNLPAQAIAMAVKDEADAHTQQQPQPPQQSKDDMNPNHDHHISSADAPAPTSKNYADEDIYSDMEDEQYTRSFVLHCLVFILITIACSGLFYYFYVHEWQPYQLYYRMSYIAVLWWLFTLFLLLNLCDKFHAFHDLFSECCRRASVVFLALTIVCGILEYVLWSLVDENLLLKPEAIGEQNFFISLVAIDVLWYAVFVFLFCALMSNWNTLSYWMSETLWVQALLYISVVGYVFIAVCRALRRRVGHDTAVEDEGVAWFKQHDTYRMVREMMRVTTWLFLIFVVLFGCCIPLFGSAVRYVSDFGTFYAIGGFMALAFAVMLTPLMPGSIVDLAGGFLLVFVLVENHGLQLSVAWLIAVAIVVLLHYCGACAQWCIGRMRVVQFYLNTHLPPELLAASDAVLETAHCGLVGLIGYVFMDTANGLNQGRMSMRFWTQFCSEWSCIPNALAVVSLGATIALPAIYPAQYASMQTGEDGDVVEDEVVVVEDGERILVLLIDVLIPLLALIAGLVQFSGVSLAARKLGASVQRDEYMMAREKWTALQFLYAVSGLVPSRAGWEHDVLQLSARNPAYPSEYRKSLFADVLPLHRWYTHALHADRIQRQKQLNKTRADRQSISTSRLKTLILEKYKAELEAIRNMHYSTIEAQYDVLIHDKQWLIDPKQTQSSAPMDKKRAIDYLIDNDEDEDARRFFSAQNVVKYKWRKLAQIGLLVLYVATFWVSFYRIYWQSDYVQRVAQGLQVFETTTRWHDWLVFGVFVVLWLAYNHHAIWRVMRNSGKQLWFVLTCCRINRNIESRFATPVFDRAAAAAELNVKEPQKENENEKEIGYSE